ncbi:ABC transporter permease [Spirochaeta thermophila]|uniref:Oligopeptide transport system permease protein OppC n=1 Tax=Winmispira thermophila (strain ATCC 49972 / DSM 6192 / RI 19.B1) TaxID=665571 RepID=E0RNX8_WINT6|nr:ABC transporter permease [Spirochaeta thermophila]ADN01251.1 oligopeptide ABC transporter, permease protein, inner membrane component [Spirochaeta thermophila DSM 6192]
MAQERVSTSDTAAQAEEHGLSNIPSKGTSLTKDAWRRLKKHRMAMVGLGIVTFYVLISLLAPILPIHRYDFQVPVHQNLPPSLRPAGEVWYDTEYEYLLKKAAAEGRSELTEEEKAHLEEIRYRIEHDRIVVDGKEINPHTRVYVLGTDYLGRDMLARIIYGGQISIAIGVIGTLTSVLIGILVGAIAGYLGGRVDYILMRIVDVMYGLPYMLIVIILMAIFGNNMFNLFFALALVSWLTVARVVRGQIISLKNAEFVEAARAMGAPTSRIIFRHLVPNTLGVIIVFSSLRIPSFIMMEAFLSFLGLGISAPYASWGSLIRDGVEGMTLYPWRLFFPALAMTLFLFAMNFLGDGLRDAFDPKSKNAL